MKTNNRGMTGLELGIALAVLAGVGYLYMSVFAPGRNKKVADKTEVATAQAQQQAIEAKKEADAMKLAAADAAAAHAKEIALRDQMDRNAAAFSAQAKAILASDPNPSEYTIVAIGLLDSVETSLGIQFTLEQRKAFMDRVVPLLKHNAEVESQLAAEKARSAALAAGKDAEHAHALASDAHANELAGQLSNTSATLVTTSGKAASLAASNAAWANNEQTWIGRAKAAGALLLLLLIAIFAISWRLRGKDKTLGDTVALIEQMKGWVAAGVKDVGELKAKMKEWNGGDTAHENAISKIKTELRL
jgi:type II secretory pathway pseudopilin PulG